MPSGDVHEELRQTYERRRADATAAGFAVLAALGPELVRIELSEDPHTAAPLALSLEPEKAELTGERARVLRKLAGREPKPSSFRSNVRRGAEAQLARTWKWDIEVRWSGREESGLG